MIPLSNVTLIAVASPFPAEFQDAPGSKPDGKSGKDGPKKDKIKPNRKLSPFEEAAIERLKGFDPETARVLREELPKKSRKDKMIACIDERLKEVKGRRKAIKVAQKMKVAKEPQATEERARLKLAKTDLEAFRRFYDKGELPRWYKDLLKKHKKEGKEKKGPESKPAPQQPGGRRDGLIILPNAVLFEG